MTQAGQSWGMINYSSMSSVKILVKVYETSSKSTFKIGYKIDNCDLSDDAPANFSANAFGDSTLTVTSDNLTISTTESDIA